jgi:NADH-quinone oxidoreductase subunit H
VIFLISATAELNRPPFDLVEAEQELVGGFHTEYSSIRFALFFLAEFMNVITMSAIMVTLFFGGPAGPVLFDMTWLWPTVWFFAKVLVFLFAFVWFRATLPRLRYDQLMNLGWKVMIPLALGWLLVISAVRLRSAYDWNPVVTFAIGSAIAVPCTVLLLASFRAGDRAYVRDMADAGMLPEGDD